MPARLRWSSRASPSGRSGSAVSRRTASCSSQSGPSRSGPRWPTTCVLVLAQHQLDDAELETRRRPCRRCRGRRGPGGRACSSAGRGRRPARTPPSSDGCGASTRWSCVDAGQQVLAARDRLDDGAAGQVGGGDGGHPEVGAHRACAPTAPWCSVPGRPPDRVSLGHGGRSGPQPQPARGRRRTRRRRSAARSGVGPEPSSCSPSARSTVIRPERAAAGGLGQRLGGGLERPRSPASSGQVSRVLPPRST